MRYFTSVTEAAKEFSSSPKGRENWDDSFWICDLGETASLLRKWSSKLPRIRPYYAMKVAPYPDMIKVLLLEGAGVDCAGKEEIETALELGAKPDDIIYSNTNKQISHLLYAKSKNVNLTVYDCEAELRKIHAHYPESKLLLRVKGEMDHPEFPMNERFGATLTNSKSLLKLSNELGLQTIGFSFHVGSACRDKRSYTNILDKVTQLLEYASTMGIKCEMVDVGAGFEGTDYTAEHFDEATGAIQSWLNMILSDSRFSQLQVIGEPGRYFAESSFSLVANVIAVNKDNNDIAMYTLNEGICTSFFTIIARGECGAKRQIIPLKKDSKKGVVCRSRLYGPACGAFDFIGDFDMIDLDVGDWVMRKECGAYTFSLTTNFNGFKTGITYNIVTEKNKKYLSEESLKYIATSGDTE